MAYKVLLVEDDARIREITEDYFDAKDPGLFALRTAEDGETGLRMIDEEEWDLILLDIMLPGIDGFTLMRHIRTSMDVPVIFLTAKSLEEDKIRGYELGCDDYVTKPFSLAELYAKVNAILKRAKGQVISRVITCGSITVDMMTLTVRAGGREVELPPKEYELLVYFMEHKGWVLSRDTLLDKVWGRDFYGNDRIVDNHIKKLRKALGDSGDQIRTVISKGYKMVENK